MSSNSALLSNSMSPLINSIELKSNYQELKYKLRSGLGSCSKQRREIAFTPQKGSTNSINLLKYGLCTNVYLKVVIQNTAVDVQLGTASLIATIDEITLSSHSKILERLDRIKIMKYILDKAPSDNADVLALTGYNAMGGAMTQDVDYVQYVPLPFSFFGNMSSAKDLLHLQQLTVNIKWASDTDIVKTYVAGTNPWDFKPSQLIINYLELPSAKLNELWNANYSTARPTNQLLLTTFKENEKEITVDASLKDYAIDLTTKGCVVRSYICVRDKTGRRAGFKPVEKISFKANGQTFYAARTDELSFEKIIMGGNYNAMSTGKTDRSDFHAIYCFDFSVIDIPAYEKYSQAISFKNLSAPQYILSLNKNEGSNDYIVEVVHETLNLVAFNKQDGSAEMILSV